MSAAHRYFGTLFIEEESLLYVLDVQQHYIKMHYHFLENFASRNPPFFTVHSLFLDINIKIFLNTAVHSSSFFFSFQTKSFG
jgi:hypothetical protein